jgi:hypothetical protein
MASARPLLLTGSHRSGSTWVGRMMAEAPAVFYIHEPFNVSDPPNRGVCNTEFKYWFTYITRENESGFYKPIRNTIELRYDWIAALKSVKSVTDINKLKREYRQFLEHRLKGSRLLMKDPMAFFSSEWLAERFGMDVLILIRHPAAFVSSVKKLNWSHPFSHFVAQTLLMKTVLYSFEREIKEYAAREHEIIDQAILLWRLIHSTIVKYQQEHKNWIFVRHEDLSRDPVQGFRTLFTQLNIEFSEHVKDVIEKNSNSDNPSDVSAPVGSESSLKRNSRSNIWNWKNRLSPSEIERIRNGVEDISKAFYSDCDW